MFFFAFEIYASDMSFNFVNVGGRSLLQERSEASTSGSEDHNPAASVTHEKATIAGLEPINFITLATPHLGCRDNQHVRNQWLLSQPY